MHTVKYEWMIIHQLIALITFRGKDLGKQGKNYL